MEKRNFAQTREEASARLTVLEYLILYLYVYIRPESKKKKKKETREIERKKVYTDGEMQTS